VDGFVDALVTGDIGAGIRILDQLEERGRDSRAFLDQVVDALRTELLESLGDGVMPARPVADLSAAARRLASIDPDRNGVGWLRLQIELALFGSASAGPAGPGRASTVGDTTVARPAAPASTAPRAESNARSSPPERKPETSRGDAESPTRPTQSPSPPGAPDAGPPPESAEGAPAPAPEPGAPIHAGPPDAADARRAEAEAPRPPSDSASSDPSSSGASPGALSTATPPGALSTATPPSGALEELLATWPAIVAKVSQHPPTKPLIVACRPVAVEGNVVTLGFPEEQAFLKDVAERKKSVIEQGIGESLGRAVSVRCVVANVELTSSAGADDAFLMAEARRIFADDLVDVGEIT